jgi:UDP-N-acetylglucosamine 2-epimerase
LCRLDFENGNSFLVTLHRQENVDNQKRLVNVAKNLSSIKELFGLDLVFPIHPRTKDRSTSFGISFEGVNA